MDYAHLLEISAAGMSVQKTRLEVAAQNLANTQTVMSESGRPYQPLRVVAHSAMQSAAQFSSLMDGMATAAPVQASIVQDQQAKPRIVHEPGHPNADKNGMVKYPGVDHLEQMVTITEALRAYEANLAAVQASKTMALRALEIGGGNP